jgi:hypothetical protein
MPQNGNFLQNPLQCYPWALSATCKTWITGKINTSLLPVNCEKEAASIIPRWPSQSFFCTVVFPLLNSRMPSANLTQQAQADQEHVRKRNFQKITGKRKTERFQDIMLFHSFLFIAHHRLSHSQHIYISERSTNMAHFRDPFFVLFFLPLPLVLLFLLFISSFKTHLILTFVWRRQRWYKFTKDMHL